MGGSGRHAIAQGSDAFGTLSEAIDLASDAGHVETVALLLDEREKLCGSASSDLML